MTAVRALMVTAAVLAAAATVVAADGTGARADTSAAEPPLIVVGEAVGDVRLGMTRAAVLRAWGKPRTERAFTFPGGKRGLAARYVRHGARATVTYSGGRVVWIETESPYYETRGGVGVGAPIAAAGKLPGFERDLCDGGYSRSARGALTSFVPRGELIARVRIVKHGFFDC